MRVLGSKWYVVGTYHLPPTTYHGFKAVTP